MPKRAHKAKSWRFEDAKAKLSEVLERAYSDGPQLVAAGGKRSVVILPKEQYEKLTGKNGGQTPSIVETFLGMPRVPGFKIPQRDKTDRVPHKPPFSD
jgi:prevent-host-death family protein